MRLEVTKKGRTVFLEGKPFCCVRCHAKQTTNWYFHSFDKRIYCRRCTLALGDSDIGRTSTFWLVDNIEEGEENAG